MAIRLAAAILSPMAAVVSRLWSPKGMRGSRSAADRKVAHPILADQAWSCFSDEGEEYLCLRLSRPGEGTHGRTRTIGSRPLDSSYRLLAAAEIGVTLDFHPPREIVIFESFRDGVQ